MGPDEIMRWSAELSATASALRSDALRVRALCVQGRLERSILRDAADGDTDGWRAPPGPLHEARVVALPPHRARVGAGRDGDTRHRASAARASRTA
jgi:hypothetical protein